MNIELYDVSRRFGRNVAVDGVTLDAGPGVLGYGSQLLWTGRHEGGAPLYDLKVTPGDATVRRRGRACPDSAA